MPTIVIVDDHPIVRAGLRRVFDITPGYTVVGEAETGTQALETVCCLQPDLLILDLVLPELSGQQVIEQLGRLMQNTRVIVFSIHSNEAYAHEALAGGAMAYVTKSSGIHTLLAALDAALNGQHFLSPPLDASRLEEYQHQRKDTLDDPFESLTRREREVLRRAALGHSGPQIADELVISPRTVEKHRSHLLRKLNLRNQTELVCYALRRGLIGDE